MTLDDVDLDQRIVWALARAAVRGRCRSAARPPKPSTGTYGREKATGWPTWRCCGSAATDP